MDSDDETWSNASTLYTEEMQEYYDSETYSVSDESTDSERSWNPYEDENIDGDPYGDTQSTFRYFSWKDVPSAESTFTGRSRPFLPNQRVTLLDLPTDVLERIFTHLGPRTAFNVTLVSKALYNMSKANRGRPWRRLIARQLGLDSATLQKRKLHSLLKKYSWEICDSHDDHYGKRVKRYRKSEYRFCSDCRLKLDWEHGADEFNEFTRRHILEKAMARYKIAPRSDSALCTKYIEEGEWTDIPQLVKTMLRMHIIYEHSICMKLYHEENQARYAESRRRRSEREARYGPSQPSPDSEHDSEDYSSDGSNGYGSGKYGGRHNAYQRERRPLSEEQEEDAIDEFLRENKGKREKRALRLYRRAVQWREENEEQDPDFAVIKDCACGRPLLQAYILKYRKELEQGENLNDDDNEDSEQHGKGIGSPKV